MGVERMGCRAGGGWRGRSGRGRKAAGLAGLCLVTSGLGTAFGQGPPSDVEQPQEKSRYTLFNPVPRGLMRDLSADRPDATESPFTVDAGHLQVELSFAEWRKGGGAEDTSILPTNIKLGLTEHVDAQLVLNPNLRVRQGGRTREGTGDTQVRVKVNLWGNDGGEGFYGETALAVMPFVQFPTADDKFGDAEDIEGGVIVPFTTSLPNDFALTVMAEVDFVRDGGGGHDTVFVHTAVVGREIHGPLSGYLEYVGVQPIDGDGDYQASVGVGLTYLLTDDVQLDVGSEVGLTAAADDLRVFAGMTFRL